MSKRTVRKYITEYGGGRQRTLYLLCEGRLVNLVAGDGHPAEIMDMTFALQALVCCTSTTTTRNRAAASSMVPYDIDEQVASYKLESLGIRIDDLTGSRRSIWQLEDLKRGAAPFSPRAGISFQSGLPTFVGSPFLFDAMGARRRMRPPILSFPRCRIFWSACGIIYSVVESGESGGKGRRRDVHGGIPAFPGQ